MKKYRFITIESKEAGYHIRNNRSNTALGDIEWDNGWGQWVFYSHAGVMWSVSCLEDVIDFIKNEIPKEKR